MRDHPLHALCPYFAMFPPKFAAHAIERHTEIGDLVFDPFSGRGTTLLESLLLGRRALATDINPVAYCISAAKAHPPRLGRLMKAIDKIENDWRREKRASFHEAEELPTFFAGAFHPDTLAQIQFLRRRLDWRRRSLDRFITALSLAQLHGEMDRSPNFFSNQMPHTISTKPAYSLRYWRRHGLQAPKRNVFEILRQKARFRLSRGRPGGDASVALTDVRFAHRRFVKSAGGVTAVITSPPYLDVTAYEEDQWLRLWFLGGAPHPTWGLTSKDDRHRSEILYWEFLTEAWQGVAPLLKRRGSIVCRLGSRRLGLADLESKLRESIRRVWSKVELSEAPRKGRIRGSRASLMQAGSKGCRFEMDVAYTVSA